MQVTTMANIITNAKIVKKNSNEAKAIEVQEKTIIITLQLLEAKIKPLSNEVTVMT